MKKLIKYHSELIKSISIIDFRIRLIISLSLITSSILLGSYYGDGWYFLLFLLGVWFFNYTSVVSGELEDDIRYQRELRLKKLLKKRLNI